MAKVKKLTLDLIQREVKKVLEIKDSSNSSFQAGVVLFSSLECGPNINKISKFSGIPRKTVAGYAKRLRKNGIWRGSEIHANWFDKENGGLEFILDVGVAEGLFKKTPDKSGEVKS